MKRAVVLVIVALAISTNCSNERAAENNARRAEVTTTPVSAPKPERPASEDLRSAPPEFRSVDFKNFSYPTNIRGNITLKDGEQIFNNREGGGDMFRFVEVGYADLTGDGKEEAIARLSVVSCGASCDGG